MELDRRYLNRVGQALPARLDELGHDALLELLAMYSPVCGPVRKVSTYLPPACSIPVMSGQCDYFDFDHVAQRMTGFSSYRTGVRANLFGGGKAFDLPGMVIGSLGEVLERSLGALSFFASSPEYELGTFTELTRRGLRCLAPELMPLFTKAQYREPRFPFEPFTARTQLAWRRGRRLLSDEEVWVPAQLVELFYARRRGEAMIGYAVSGGLSCHRSREEALFHGVTELIERDALNIHWYCGVPPPRIEIEARPRSTQLARLVDELRRRPTPVRLFLHVVDIPEVPVVTAIGIDRWARRYSYHAGGGADLDGEAAVSKALAEYGQADGSVRMALLAPDWSASRILDSAFAIGPDDPVGAIDLFVKAAFFYGYETNRAKLDWYLAGSSSVCLADMPRGTGADPAARYATLLQVLRRRHLDPIVFDSTPPGLRHLKLIKVFLPELTQAFLQSLPMLGHPRFQLGAELGGRAAGSFTPDPMPYP